MSIPIRCKQCGYEGISRAIQIVDSKNITIGGGTEPCPRCGGRANIQGGTYDFVGEVMTSFTAPGMTKAKVVAAKKIVEQFRDGKMDQSQASDELSDIGSSLSGIWNWIGDNASALNTVLMIINLVLMYYVFDQTSADTQVDREIAQRQTQALARIRDELQKVADAPPETQAQEIAKPSKQKASLKGTTARENRHQRRKRESIERRKGSSTDTQKK